MEKTTTTYKRWHHPNCKVNGNFWLYGTGLKIRSLLDDCYGKGSAHMAGAELFVPAGISLHTLHKNKRAPRKTRA